MTAFALRLTALICMAIDQVGLVLFPGALALRAVGRVALPLYCFLLAQGYRHTRSLRRYALRLAVLAVLSEVPFNLVHFGTPLAAAGQNVLFTLLLALLAMCCCDALIERRPLAAAVCPYAGAASFCRTALPISRPATAIITIAAKISTFLQIFFIIVPTAFFHLHLFFPKTVPAFPRRRIPPRRSRRTPGRPWTPLSRKCRLSLLLLPVLQTKPQKT